MARMNESFKSFAEVEASNPAIPMQRRLFPISMALGKVAGTRREINLSTPTNIRTAYRFLLDEGRAMLGDKFDRLLARLGIANGFDLADLLADPNYSEVILADSALKGVSIKFDAETSAAVKANRMRLKGEKELGEFCAWTWDEKEALTNADADDVWVIRTNLYPDVPALYVYPNGNIDAEALISKYSHKLAAFYKHELAYKHGKIDGTDIYWLARPCTYAHFLERPIPDGSELAEKVGSSEAVDPANESVKIDRTILKRIVEEYGSKDVSNFVKNLD